MRGGLLRHKLTIEKKTLIKYSSTGEQEFTWATFAQPYARVITQGAREFERVDQTKGVITHVFVIRHRDGITDEMRAIYQSQTYEITGYAEQHGRNREGWIMARRET